jgi:hypothetical protein
VGRRLYNAAVVCSGVVFCISIVAFIAASSVDPTQRHLTLHPNLHVSIGMGPYGPSLELFNNASYGPYRGGTIGMTSPGRPSPVRTRYFDFVGVYYRDFLWPDGRRLRTFSLSLMYIVLLSGALPGQWLIQRTRRTKRGFPVERPRAGP